MADGKGFLNPFGYFAPVGTPAHRVFETAVHPPLYTVFLAIPAKLGSRPPQEQRILTALLGTATVVLIGLLGRASPATVPASSPRSSPRCTRALWVNDAILGLETLYCFLRDPRAPRVLPLLVAPDDRERRGIAVLCLSLATLTRSEGTMLFVLFALPTLFLVPRARCGGTLQVRRRHRRWSRSSSSVHGSCATSPRSRNRRCSAPGSGGCSLYGNCDADVLGPDASATGTTSARSRTTRPTSRSRVLDEMAPHQGDRLHRRPRGPYPGRGRARAIGRIWDVYRPFQNVELNEFYERRGHAASWAVLIGYYLLLPFAIGGLVVMRRRRIPIFPLPRHRGVGHDHRRAQLRDHPLPRPGRRRAPGAGGGGARRALAPLPTRPLSGRRRHPPKELARAARRAGRPRSRGDHHRPRRTRRAESTTRADRPTPTPPASHTLRRLVRRRSACSASWCGS